MRVFREERPATILGIVMVDCVAPNATDVVGMGLTNPTPLFWAFGKIITPLGLTRLTGDLHLLSSFDPVYSLPKEVIPIYLSNLYKQKYFDSIIREWVQWPSSAALAKETVVYLSAHCLLW